MTPYLLIQMIMVTFGIGLSGKTQGSYIILSYQNRFLFEIRFEWNENVPFQIPILKLHIYEHHNHE
jgi:hypothetical protein